MCGLWGWVRERGSPARAQTSRTLALSLMFQNIDRGAHSWGFLADGRIARGVGPAAGMPAGELRRMSSARVMIGHTRHATAGRVTVDNAHPFTRDGWVWAHNGVLSNHAELNRKGEKTGECHPCDSWHLGPALIRGDLSPLAGYGAVCHTRPDDRGAVYLSLFNGGDMSVGVVPGFGVVWSSDEKHLDYALTLADLGGRGVEVFDGLTYRVRPDGTDVAEWAACEVGYPRWQWGKEEEEAFRAATRGDAGPLGSDVWDHER